MAERAPQLEMSLSDLADFLNLDLKEVKELVVKITDQKLTSPFVAPEVVREILKQKGVRLKPQVLSFQMLKGGVAKTTTALNFGIRAHMYGARVLFVDLDQQANLSFALGFNDEEAPVWVDIVEKKKNIEECVVRLEEGFDLIPSSLNNSVLDRVLLNSNRNWAQAVAGPLAKIKHRYDLIIIDTAPALSATNTAVAVASNKIILPVNPDRFSYMGLKKSIEELEMIQEDFKTQFKLQILFTKFDAREKQSHEIWQKCSEDFAEKMLKTYIRSSTEVKNTIATEKTLFAGKNPVKNDFDNITREILALGV
ncbi:MAG: ParA family protein [Bdellovibrionia bacterium]